MSKNVYIKETLPVTNCTDSVSPNFIRSATGFVFCAQMKPKRLVMNTISTIDEKKELYMRKTT